MNIGFFNKKVLITGATRGIGKELAIQYSNLGATVVITGTQRKKPDWNRANIHYEVLNISAKTKWQDAISKIVDKYDGFDICINNAGINKIASIDELDIDDLNNIILVNLTAPIFISSVVSKSMIKNRYGFIINIGSIFGVVSKEKRNPYTATKSGIIGATKTIALDLAKYNILVNTISPGFVDTELTRNVLGKEGMDLMKQKIPLQRLAKPFDIVNTTMFLTSDYNTYITGQNIIIDGGFTLE
jgi:3-oxoacyl-[acyl-carrier protein] reductase